MKCADCNCTPNDCKASPTAFRCPNCTLEECCCWSAIQSVKI